MTEQEIRYEDVLRAVGDFLCRYRDAYTRAHREDLAQEAAIETWRRRASLRDPGCAVSFARTIARRLRFQAVHRNVRCRVFRSLDQDPRLLGALAVADPGAADGRAFRVGREWADAGWLVDQLDDVLRRLGPINGGIVRGYYEGSTCRELGALYGLPPAGVKARLHRSRSRIRETFAARVDRALCGAAAGRSRRALSSTTGGTDT